MVTGGNAEVRVRGWSPVKIRDIDIARLATQHAIGNARHCRRIVQELNAFSLWILRREALEQAAQDKTWRCDPFSQELARFAAAPWLPDRPGGCNVLFVTGDKLNKQSPLRPAFVLPLIWKPGTSDSPRLPLAMRRLAEDVRRALGRGNEYGLHLNEHAGLASVDLSEVSWTCGSGWAPLAASLLLLEMGGRPRRDVVSSGAWRDDLGMVSVDGEGEKAALAREFGCELLFLPTSEAEKVQTAGNLPQGLEIRPFPFGERDPGKALRDLLIELEVPPRIEWGDEFFDRCKRYANSLPREDSERREEYIRANITRRQADIIRKAGLPAELKDLGRLAILMSRASAALLPILVFRPRQVLLIHTSRDKAEAGLVKKHLAAWCIEGCGEPICADVDMLNSEAIQAKIREFFCSHGENCAVDVTGLTKSATAAAAMAGAACGAAVLCFHSDDPLRSGHQTGTERPFVVSAPQRAIT